VPFFAITLTRRRGTPASGERHLRNGKGEEGRTGRGREKPSTPSRRGRDFTGWCLGGGKGEEQLKGEKLVANLRGTGS